MSELEFKIAKDICLLNRWITPGNISRELGRELKREEFRFAMAALEAQVPKSKWILVWNESVTEPTIEATGQAKEHHES